MSAPPPPPPPPPTLTVRTPSPPKSWFGGTSSPPPATAATAPTAPPPPPPNTWFSRLTRKNPEPNWKKFTTGPNGSNGSPSTSNNTRKKNNSFLNAAKVAAREQEIQGFFAKAKQGLTYKNSRYHSRYNANSEANYQGDGDTQTRTKLAMKETSNSNRIDRLLALFKAALKGSPTGKNDNASIDIGQYVYVLQENPGSTNEKKDFVKIMESLDAFPKDTAYDKRIAMLTPEFIKTHRLEHIGMKIDREKTQKKAGTNKQLGQNIHTYREYTEEELNAIIKKFKQTTFDDVLGLFIILTMYLLSVLSTGSPKIFYDETMMHTIKMLIYNNRFSQVLIKREFQNVNLNKNEKQERNRANIEAKKKEEKKLNFKTGLTIQSGLSIFVSIYAGLTLTSIVIVPPVGIGFAVAGSILVGLGVFLRGIASIIGKGGLLQSIDERDQKMYEKFFVNKDKITAGGLLTILYVLLTQDQNEEFVDATEINFKKDHYNFLKEFKPMFSGWYTETELYNFVFLFTRERLKESLGSRYDHVRQLPEGWHEFTTDGKTYYNSDEFSKKEESPLNRYKLVSWIMPMVPFVNKPNYNENITIYPPSAFSHGPQTPVAGQIQQSQLSKNFGVPQATPTKNHSFQIHFHEQSLNPSSKP